MVKTLVRFTWILFLLKIVLVPSAYSIQEKEQDPLELDCRWVSHYVGAGNLT